MICLYTGSLQAKIQHVILDDDRPNIISYKALDTLVQLRPLTYTFITDPGVQPGPDIVPFYTAWFENVLSRAKTEDQRRQLEFIWPILQHGAAPSSYQPQEQGIITFLFTNNMLKHCGRYTAGCYQNNVIYIPPTASKTTFIHEIGHSLRQGDLYSMGLSSEQGEYGTGVQDSIMNESKTLTCDDADGLINAVYRSLVRQNPNQPELRFDSLCANEKQFKNARQLNRSVYIVDGRELSEQGSRTIYTYCQDGTIKSVAELRADHINQLVTLLRPEKDCESVLNSLVQWEKRPGASYTEIPYTSGAVLEVGPDSSGTHIARVLAHDNTLLYFFARLPEGYNLVYKPIVVGSDRVLFFVYDPNNPAQHYAYIGKKSIRDVSDYMFACSADEETCGRLKVVFEKYQRLFAKPYHTVYKHWGERAYSSYVENAQQWNTFLVDK